MNIILKKSVKAANMDILKQKMNLVYIVELKNMEDHFVLNVDMILIKVEMKEIILYAKIVFLLINIQMTISFLIEPIIIHFQLQLYLPKENVIIVNQVYLIHAGNVNLRMTKATMKN